MNSFVSLLMWSNLIHQVTASGDAGASHRQGWTESPNTRGTIDIIWTCLFTLSICCWTVVHLDITHNDPQIKEAWWRRPCARTLCVLIAIFAPEALVATALLDMLQARATTPCQELLDNGWTHRHGLYLLMGGFSVTITPPDNRPVKIFYSKSLQRLNELVTGNIVHAPTTTEEEICDKSKSDPFLKLVALLQVAWLLVQCIARTAQGLPITTLEISTLSDLPSTFAAYILWWNKPYDVAIPTQLKLLDNAFSTNTEEKIYSYGSDRLNRTFHTPWRIAGLFFDIFEMNDDHLSKYRIFAFIISSVSLVFGGVHCIAWNYSFPSHWEQIAWRICSIVVGGSVPLSFGLSYIVTRFDNISRSEGQEAVFLCLWSAIVLIPFLLYLLARFFLLFEILYELRSLPSGCYQTVDWWAFFPHV